MGKKVSSAVIGGGASSDHERHYSDFYPTPWEVTEALCLFLDKYGYISQYDMVHEPACGDGQMSRVLEKYFAAVVSTDLRIDSGYGEGGIDFLKLHDMSPVDHMVITNPPFDKAVEFILRCDRLRPPLYAMLLKSSYWQAAKRLSLFTATNPELVLPLTWRPAFAPERGSAPTMEFQWTVWTRDYSGDTKYIPLSKPSNQQAFL